MLARVLGVLWGSVMGAVAVGSVLEPPLIGGLGTRGALVASGLFLPLVTFLAWPHLLSIDRTATPPLRELGIPKQVPMFAPLSVAAKEHLAASLVPIAVPAGAPIVTEGEYGDRFYMIDEGEADVVQAGRHLGTRGPGDYFGEIALIRDVPRTATVTARTAVELYALDREDFLAAVTGHAAGREAAEAVVEERLATVAAPPA